MDRVEELEAKRRSLIMECYNIINNIELSERIDLKKMTMTPGIAEAMNNYLKKRHEIEEINKEINSIICGKHADKIIIDEFEFKED